MSLKIFESKFKADIDRMLDEGVKPYLISQWLLKQEPEHYISKDSIYKYQKMKLSAQKTQMDLIATEKRLEQPQQVDVMAEIAKTLKKLDLLERKGLQSGVQVSSLKDLINLYKEKAEFLRIVLQLTQGKTQKDLATFLTEQFEGRDEDESIEIDFRREFFRGIRKTKGKKDKAIPIPKGDTEGHKSAQDNNES